MPPEVYLATEQLDELFDEAADSLPAEIEAFRLQVGNELANHEKDDVGRRHVLEVE